MTNKNSPFSNGHFFKKLAYVYRRTYKTADSEKLKKSRKRAKTICHENKKESIEELRRTGIDN